MCSKLAEFYLRGMDKLPDKWPKVIQNSGEWTVDWKEFIKLFMNKLHFTKTEIIDASPQYQHKCLFELKCPKVMLICLLLYFHCLKQCDGGTLKCY